MSTAIVFPGQGSQTVGMGKDIYDSFSSARAVFEEVDDALGEKLSDIIFNGSFEELTLTQNAQPAIMAVSIAILRVLTTEGNLNLKDNISFMAGHSLGEYTALCASGAINLYDTAKLLRKRGEAMQSADKNHIGGMLSLIDSELSFAKVYEIAKQASLSDSFCEVSNDNSFGQIVLSGHKTALARAETIAKDMGIKLVVPLSVSAPFHCSLMKPAKEVMAPIISQTAMKTPQIPIVMNVIARACNNVEEIKHLLLEQITRSVRWRESILFMKNSGVDCILEVGNGNILTKLKKKIDSEIKGLSISNKESIEEYL